MFSISIACVDVHVQEHIRTFLIEHIFLFVQHLVSVHQIVFQRDTIFTIASNNTSAVSRFFVCDKIFNLFLLQKEMTKS